jgi:hypothetical protein
MPCYSRSTAARSVTRPSRLLAFFAPRPDGVLLADGSVTPMNSNLRKPGSEWLASCDLSPNTGTAAVIQRQLLADRELPHSGTLRMPHIPIHP